MSLRRAAETGAGRVALSTASRFAAIQRAFNDRLREWHYQRQSGARYQVWHPPGIVFARLKKDYYEHGRRKPCWETEWGFVDRVDEPYQIGVSRQGPLPLHLVLGALSGQWAVEQAKRRELSNWVIVESDESRLFQAFYRAINGFGVDPDEPLEGFPNLRLLLANERLSAGFFPAAAFRSVHIHLPYPERTSKPKREALFNQRFVSDIADSMEIHGEIHIVTDNEAVVEQACGLLTKSRIFSPMLSFPFHVAGVPAAYSTRELLEVDISKMKAMLAGRVQSPDDRRPRLFYTRWEKKPPHLPNFRFKAGKGYGAVVQGLLDR
eukprot:TRINITY_DN37622_c0_g1_i1.p1 TRINITY_DN37622_c0_g1~~TRINITY_DN37622_c0_g1_i1.p1  ORF type:complete len:322 (-),score=44.88 TRINITY_DN37622_c0_g1_i1:125-1090(-)